MELYRVTYLARSGDESDAEVKVDKIELDGRTLYYATNLRLWGCGKNAATPEAAVRLLVQDMATILNITQL